MAQLGFRTIDEMIGRSDLLDMRKALDHYKAKGLDFSKIFYRPDVGPDVAVRKVREQEHGLESDARRDDARPGLRPGARAGRAGRRSTCRSATSTARSARSSAAS